MRYSTSSFLPLPRFPDRDLKDKLRSPQRGGSATWLAVRRSEGPWAISELLFLKHTQKTTDFVMASSLLNTFPWFPIAFGIQCKLVTLAHQPCTVQPLPTSSLLLSSPDWSHCPPTPQVLPYLGIFDDTEPSASPAWCGVG
jgi:hypothetical protein